MILIMNKSPALSPSLYHHRKMRKIAPKYSFATADQPFDRWQRALRGKLKIALGIPQIRTGAEAVKLNARTLWKREHELGTIEKVVFTAQPGADVTAYLCLPKESTPPLGAMICLQGHSSGAHVSVGLPREDDGLQANIEGDRDFGLQCMARGMAALCIEQRSFGERREKDQQRISSHGCHDAAMHALMLGQTLAGERVFDVDRGLDYLASRGDIDMKNVGVMGNSGGGTISIFAAALLPRLAFAMPSCSFCTYADSIMSIYHCADNYVPGLLQIADSADVLGLFAPRPVVIVAGKEDEIFPIKATRKAFRDLQNIYAAAGAKENCKLVVGSEGHRFYADQAWPELLKRI